MPAAARVFLWYRRDHIGFEPGYRPRPEQFNDACWIGEGIDGGRDQNERRRRMWIMIAGEKGCRSERRYAALAQSDDGQAWCQPLYGVQDTSNIRIKAKRTPVYRDIPDIEPVHNIDAEIGKQAENKVAQENRKMAG